ncbi:MAG: UDP-N-acetylglucosamine 2-epimerase (non-hydrolyzing), partial [Gorillibacterium sp.]|nr:UDP-N-acetylglucosamine 2-epimerase (non-hydrolyzing) [Gorillibacterium sp.]
MKIVTILGTRPEIIRLSLILQALDSLAEEHTLVHTGQNFVPALSGIFFEQLRLRQPDLVFMQERKTLGEQLAIIFAETEKVLAAKQPDAVLLLGDTNSALTAIIAERMGIPVVHMEAGNRCFDRSVPEENNRRVIDAVSSINMPYTPQSKQNLLREGVPTNRIILTGNPIYEVLQHYKPDIDASSILERLNLSQQGYFLVTIHRAENVDNPQHLAEIVEGLGRVAEAFGQRIICSLHPRTQSRMDENPLITFHPLVEIYEPFGFFDFVKLEQNARCALTDSGTVQEECCLFQVPTVTIRRTTERPETVDCGSNVVSGLDAGRILQAVKTMCSLPRGWNYPAGYVDQDVSSKV